MSSIYGSGHEGFMAVEGTISSEWETCASTLSEDNPWLLIDFGNSYTISSINIIKRNCCRMLDVFLLTEIKMIQYS